MANVQVIQRHAHLASAVKFEFVNGGEGKGLEIPDPLDIGGPLAGIPADRFNFPLQSVESVTLVDEHTILVGLDNSYPGGNGRVPGTPDGTEIITIRFHIPIAAIPEPSTFGLLLGGMALMRAAGRRRGSRTPLTARH